MDTADYGGSELGEKAVKVTGVLRGGSSTSLHHDADDINCSEISSFACKICCTKTFPTKVFLYCNFLKEAEKVITILPEIRHKLFP